MQNKFDYIIAGSGAAGLSLAMHMLESKLLEKKTLLIIDKNEKNSNDKTWCFWEKKENIFEEIIYKKWNCLQINFSDFNKVENILPYTYKMIRSIDFYKYCIEKLKLNINVFFVKESVNKIFNNNNIVTVVSTTNEYTSTYCFSSLLLQPPKLSAKEIYLLQHFKGQIIETSKPIFNEQEVTLMDFRLPQKYGTTFAYILPLSKTTALVEFTLFSAILLSDEQYNEELENYIRQFLNIENYKVLEIEKGQIPMTNYNFKKSDGAIIYIGTAGGNTRGSSGYTFSNIQKQSIAIVSALKQNKNPILIKHSISKKAMFFDNVFLRVLAKNYQNGEQIFKRILLKNKITQLLQFLNDEKNSLNDLNIIMSQKKLPFIKAALEGILK